MLVWHADMDIFHSRAAVGLGTVSQSAEYTESDALVLQQSRVDGKS